MKRLLIGVLLLGGMIMTGCAKEIKEAARPASVKGIVNS